jgi:hypothetical protein
VQVQLLSSATRNAIPYRDFASVKTDATQVPMAALTAEQRKLHKEAGGEVLRLSDPETNQDNVLVRAEVCEQFRSGHADLNPRDLYPALHRALQDEGWDDPQMVLLT